MNESTKTFNWVTFNFENMTYIISDLYSTYSHIQLLDFYRNQDSLLTIHFLLPCHRMDNLENRASILPKKAMLSEERSVSPTQQTHTNTTNTQGIQENGHCSNSIRNSSSSLCDNSHGRTSHCLLHCLAHKKP